MTISIFAGAATAPKSSDLPHRTAVTRDEARRIVDAIEALPDADAVSYLRFVDDAQFGWTASEVHPDRLAALVAGIGGELAERLGPLLTRAVSERRRLLVEDGTDFMTESAVSLGCDKVDEVNASWCSSNAIPAFAAVGYALDASRGLTVPAAELLDRCGNSPDGYVARLGEIAAYALAAHGADALVHAG